MDPDQHPDPDHFDNLGPHPHQIKIRNRIRIRICIKVISWIRNRIRINLQLTSQKVWNMSLLEQFFKRFWAFMWKLGSRSGSGAASASNKNHNSDPHQGYKSNPDPHHGDADPQHCFKLSLDHCRHSFPIGTVSNGLPYGNSYEKLFGALNYQYQLIMQSHNAEVWYLLFNHRTMQILSIMAESS